MSSDYPIFAYKRECFQEYADHVSLVLWCSGCNMGCPWCSVRALVSDPGEVLDVDYRDLIADHSPLEDAVVFLGGEPTVHKIGLSVGCHLAKSIGLKVKVFTNGSDAELLASLARTAHLDAVSVDFKSSSQDIERFVKTVGGLSNLKDLELRTTVHPELGAAEFDDIADRAAALIHSGSVNRHVVQRYVET
jgi:pyruvate-formate lyase-activating enzyme